MSGYYDVAVICLNGHCINGASKTKPENNSTCCKTCGEVTISICPLCKIEIRGHLHADGWDTSQVPSILLKKIPSFCHSCGHAYPWTEKRLKAVSEMLDELSELSEAEREKFKRAIDDLVREGPMTEVAILKFKKIMIKLKKESFEMVKNFTTSILSDAIRKVIFGA